MPNDQELEAKFFIQNAERMNQQIRFAGGVEIRPRTFEFNLRFDTDGDALNAQQQLLRLRRDHTTRLTFKGPMVDLGGATSRQEIEVEVSDFATSKRLLEALGYRVTRIYEKYRTTFHLGGLEIALDEMPFGVFVEIEGGDVARIKQAARDLGLDWTANITVNYLMLFEMLRERLSLEFRDLTFENFNGLVIRATDLGVRPADGG